MNDTPTPRTDKFVATWDYYNDPFEAIDHSRILERALTAARKELETAIAQRDAIEESRVMTSNIYIKTAEQRDRLLEEREQWRLSSVCRELTAQRDEARGQIEANHKAALVIERMVYEAREQRDRLAEALRSIKNELGVPQPEYPAPVANAVKIADEALQSLTPKDK